MTRLRFTDSIDTGLLTSARSARRTGHETGRDVVRLCDAAPPLERSRFAVPAAEPAHRITDAWPR
jgi:hypothetical protein